MVTSVEALQPRRMQPGGPGPEGSGDHRLWGADGVDNWELQVVYVSNKPQLASDRDMLESREVLSAPFVRYVFAEHMRDVFPVKRT